MVETEVNKVKEALKDSDISFNLIYAIIERLHALQESHNISCACGSEDIELNIINGNIILTCLQCKKHPSQQQKAEKLCWIHF